MSLPQGRIFACFRCNFCYETRKTELTQAHTRTLCILTRVRTDRLMQTHARTHSHSLRTYMRVHTHTRARVSISVCKWMYLPGICTQTWAHTQHSQIHRRQDVCTHTPSCDASQRGSAHAERESMERQSSGWNQRDKPLAVAPRYLLPVAICQFSE